MNRDQICRQQVHCLSCPLSIMRTGKECDKLTSEEIKKAVAISEVTNEKV